MLGSSFVHGPSSRNEICSEQICLLPARLTWQCALIQASTWSFCAAQSAPITIARQAWFSVILAMSCVFFSSEPGSSL